MRKNPPLDTGTHTARNNIMGRLPSHTSTRTGGFGKSHSEIKCLWCVESEQIIAHLIHTNERLHNTIDSLTAVVTAKSNGGSTPNGNVTVPLSKLTDIDRFPNWKADLTSYCAAHGANDAFAALDSSLITPQKHAKMIIDMRNAIRQLKVYGMEIPEDVLRLDDIMLIYQYVEQSYHGRAELQGKRLEEDEKRLTPVAWPYAAVILLQRLRDLYRRMKDANVEPTFFQQLETIKRLFVSESIRLNFTAWKSEELEPCFQTFYDCFLPKLQNLCVDYPHEFGEYAAKRFPGDCNRDGTIKLSFIQTKTTNGTQSPVILSVEEKKIKSKKKNEQKKLRKIKIKAEEKSIADAITASTIPPTSTAAGDTPPVLDLRALTTAIRSLPVAAQSSSIQTYLGQA
jgi:hypothetical protein